MARTTHVKKAQQRFETVIVRDENGDPVRTPVMNTRTGEQKVTKKGRLVFTTKTVPDKTKPKPPENCNHCGKPIEVGTPYKWIAPKSGPYGGRRMSRHESCPSWNVWDYSSSLSAQLARISYDFSNAVDSAASPDDVQEALNDASSSIEEIADQKQESADNIESGFGHATSSSEELAETADSLRDWAGEVGNADVPEMHECDECSGSGQVDCEECEGTGSVDEENCDACSGSGEAECEHCDGEGEDVEAWRDEVRDTVTIVDESPV